MKKRILALALAGTTAFSIFSVAASAASTHTYFHNDAYESYTATIGINNETSVMTTYGNGDVSDAILSRFGETIDPATIYAYDYFGNDYAVYMFMDAFENADWERRQAADKSYFYAAPITDQIKDVIGNDAALKPTDFVKDGFFSYNDVRANVLYEYADFLAELGLVYFTTTNQIAQVPGTSLDTILAAWDYKYDKKDIYAFEVLAADIVNSVDDIVKSYNTTANLTGYASSQLVYIMQSYDKYTDGFYATETTDPLSEYRWADLLISALEAVEAEDFASPYAYTTFSRAATAAINKYENAVTGTAQKAAIADLYAAVVSQYGRSAGADKTALVETINALYFNNKNIPDVYMPEAVNNSAYSDLYLYGYDKAAKVVDASVKTTNTMAKAVYPVYPVADYYVPAIAGGTAKAYTGNESKGTPALTVTEEYEWFWNVYALATTINENRANGTYQGIVDVVNDELAAAVEELAAVYTPAGSTALRLDEAVEDYEGAVETDYVADYFAAYTEANEIAENAEGDLATKYAIEMVIVAGESLGYQSNQTTITKGEINDLAKAAAAAEKALKAIYADTKDYNATQVLALKNAIEDAKDVLAVYNGTETVNGTKSNKVGDKDIIVKSDVEAVMDAIDAAINYKETIQGWSKNADGAWQYGEGGEYFQDGWKKIGATWYYFEDGTAVQSDWRKIDGEWYYLNSNCGAAYGWCKVDGDWYYFNGDNTMKTGWLKKEGAWYYLAASGKMVTGKQVIDGVEYTFSTEANALGQML